MKRTLQALILVLFVGFTVSSVRGQRGGDVLGFDAATVGRAGVDVAIAESIAALLTNPAGLTQIDSPWRVDFSLRGVAPFFSYQDPLNPGVEFDDAQFAPSIGVSWDPEPGDAGKKGDLRFATALLHIAGFRNELDVITQDFPAPGGSSRESNFVYTGIHTGASYRLTDDVALGLTLSLTYSDLDVNEPLEVSVLQFQGTSPLGTSWGSLLLNQLGIDKARIEGDLATEPSFGMSATMGFMWEVTDDFTIGASYRTPSIQQDHQADVSVDISRVFGEPDPVTFPDGFDVHYDGTIKDFEYPQSLAVGAAWKLVPSLRIAAEARWTNWSATMVPLTIELKNGDNPGFNAFVGGNTLEVTEALEWDDQFCFGLAVDWEFTGGWTARAGFAAQTNPIDADAATPLAPAWSEFSLALGLGYREDGWAVDAAWLHSFEKTLRVGTSTISSDLDGSTQTFSADSFMLSFSIFF